ncbi:MAG TPA: glycoside hydrolase family 3 N-terminal domain-containing protein [Thermoanaerobaculia bacterium]|jgi:beta-N-acetylhexosaminidase|nr:glycoside hydrolase family 3 N-terminal domain-containing protein [Thermoanaerobaculia bacterium]
MTKDLLGIGLTGKTLTDLERRILRENTPYAVVLFGRNIGTVAEFRDLVAEVKSLAPGKAPLFMIDEEGGRVDRLRHILPGLPSVEAFGEGEQPAELSEWFGKVIGMALRYFDIEINLAPVVDIRGEIAPKGLERRTFGADPETVVELAGAFMRGMHGAGVASCLKHWPGIGEGSGDPHYGETVIHASLEQLTNRELVPFARLGNEARAIMIGHGVYPLVEDNADLPATLSARLTTDLLRNVVKFDGVAVSDDMEMHAVSDLGSYEEITERALIAGNDVILFCSHIERVPDLQQYLSDRVNTDANVRARFEEAAQRCDAFRAHCESLRAASTPPATWDEVVDETERFIQVFERTRPHREVVIPDSERRKGSRHPGKGRTGREEWT